MLRFLASEACSELLGAGGPALGEGFQDLLSYDDVSYFGILQTCKLFLSLKVENMHIILAIVVSPFLLHSGLLIAFIEKAGEACANGTRLERGMAMVLGKSKSLLSPDDDGDDLANWFCNHVMHHLTMVRHLVEEIAYKPCKATQSEV